MRLEWYFVDMNSMSDEDFVSVLSDIAELANEIVPVQDCSSTVRVIQFVDFVHVVYLTRFSPGHCGLLNWSPSGNADAREQSNRVAICTSLKIKEAKQRNPAMCSANAEPEQQ